MYKVGMEVKIISYKEKSMLSAGEFKFGFVILILTYCEGPSPTNTYRNCEQKNVEIVSCFLVS